MTGLLPAVDLAATIPRILHQTDTREKLPEIVRDNQRRLQDMNPGWEYRFYDDEQRREFIKSEFGSEILRYYDLISSDYGACRSDLFRYLVIYALGGVYLDMKGSARHSFDQMLQPGDQFVLTGWDQHDPATQGWGEHAELKQAGIQEFQQWHIIAAPGHPFLRRVIERVLHNISSYVPPLHGTGNYGVYRLTGPVAYSLAIGEMLSQAPYRYAGSNVDLGLVYSIFPTVKAHRDAMGGHYSERRDAITRLDMRQKIVGAGFTAARALVRPLTNR